MPTLEIAQMLVLEIAVAAFIGHGFLDFWPLLKTWDWSKALPAYVIAIVTTYYVYSVVPGAVALAFFVSSAYHFGSDWTSGSDALFLGSSMIGMATYMSEDMLEQMKIPNTDTFCFAYAIAGVLCIVPSLRVKNRKKISYLMVPLGLGGIYGVMAYAILVHTPRSVWLLARRYGKYIYVGWVIFTAIVFWSIRGLSAVSAASLDIMGVMYGILAAHMICTEQWRDIKISKKELPS